jgi:hypothetical protein
LLHCSSTPPPPLQSSLAHREQTLLFFPPLLYHPKRSFTFLVRCKIGERESWYFWSVREYIRYVLITWMRAIFRFLLDSPWTKDNNI